MGISQPKKKKEKENAILSWLCMEECSLSNIGRKKNWKLNYCIALKLKFKPSICDIYF